MAHVSALSVHIRRKRYGPGGTVALDSVRFAAEAGQFVALVGPSGAGKTTLLNIVAGLDTDFEGEVVREPDTGAEGGTDARLDTGMVFQTPRLMPWLTVLDNIRLVLPEPRGRNTEQIRNLLADLGLAGFEDAYPGQLSGGMQRRGGLARAFAVRPRLLLMDEPFVSLDAPLAERLREQLVALWSRLRPTVLYVTHDLREALSLADRVLFLSARPGRIVLDEPVTLPRPRAYDDPAVAALQSLLMSRHPGLLSGDAGEGDAAGCGAAREVPAT